MSSDNQQRNRPQRKTAKLKPLEDSKLERANNNGVPLEDSPEAQAELARRGLAGSSIGAGSLRKDFKTKDGKLLAKAGALLLDIIGPDGETWAVKARNFGSNDELKAVGIEQR